MLKTKISSHRQEIFACSEVPSNVGCFFFFFFLRFFFFGASAGERLSGLSSSLFSKTGPSRFSKGCFSRDVGRSLGILGAVLSEKGVVLDGDSRDGSEINVFCNGTDKRN